MGAWGSIKKGAKRLGRGTIRLVTSPRTYAAIATGGMSEAYIALADMTSPDIEQPTDIQAPAGDDAAAQAARNLEIQRRKKAMGRRDMIVTGGLGLMDKPITGTLSKLGE